MSMPWDYIRIYLKTYKGSKASCCYIIYDPFKQSRYNDDGKIHFAQFTLGS